MKSSYNKNVLLDMAQDYLTAENEHRVFLLTFRGGWVPDMRPEDYGDYCQKEAASTYTRRALQSACDLVYADMATVIATAKAINRHEKREAMDYLAAIKYA